MDTCMHLGEVANLRIDDVDVDKCVAYVVGEGNHPRQCPSEHAPARASTVFCVNSMGEASMPISFGCS